MLHSSCCSVISRLTCNCRCSLPLCCPQYYDKEISSKRTFQPSVPDDKLCCISSQDFLQVQQQPQQQQQGPHELELARLNYELGQRKQLKAHLQKLLQQKQRAQAELNAAKERIDDLRGNMEAIKSSSRSLLETSLPEAAAVARNREAAELLPLPLYIIYAQAATAASVLGLPLRADITGSTAAAERLAAAEADAAAAKAAPAAAAAAEAVQAAKRRRKSEAQEDEAYKVRGIVAAATPRHCCGWNCTRQALNCCNTPRNKEKSDAFQHRGMLRAC